MPKLIRALRANEPRHDQRRRRRVSPRPKRRPEASRLVAASPAKALKQESDDASRSFSSFSRTPPKKEISGRRSGASARPDAPTSDKLPARGRVHRVDPRPLEGFHRTMVRRTHQSSTRAPRVSVFARGFPQLGRCERTLEARSKLPFGHSGGTGELAARA